MSLPVKGVGAMSADECIVAIALRAEQASSTASSLFVFFIWTVSFLSYLAAATACKYSIKGMPGKDKGVKRLGDKAKDPKLLMRQEPLPESIFSCFDK